MIEIERYDHVCIAVAELDPQIDFLTRVLGFRYIDRFENAEGFVGSNLMVPGRSGLGWEVLAPNGPDSYLHRFLDGPSGPGLHHIAAQVKDIRQVLDTVRTEGFEPWGERGTDPEGDPSHGMVFIHPRNGGHGFLWQLYAGESRHKGEPFEDEGEHTLGIVAINHLAHATPDRDELAGWYERVLGCTPVYRSSDTDGRDVSWRTVLLETSTRQFAFEMIEPRGPESFVQRFLDARGPNMHHVTVEVRDFNHALAALEHHGIPVFGQHSGIHEGAGWGEAFVHPRHTGGMLLQLFWEERPGAWI